MKGGRRLALLLWVLTGPGLVLGQSRFAIEVSGGVGIPGFLDWAKSRSAGPALSLGAGNSFGSGTWGWSLSGQWHYTPYNKRSAETTEFYSGDSLGTIVQVSTSDLEGGQFHALSLVATVRKFLETTSRNKTYMLAGIVVATTSQSEATVLQTIVVDGDNVGSERIGWLDAYSDWGIGVTFGLGVLVPLNEAFEGFGEMGFRAILTPDDSFPDNPDYLTAMAGLRFAL